MPPNVNEFEYVPVNNDVDQDLEEHVFKINPYLSEAFKKYFVHHIFK